MHSEPGGRWAQSITPSSKNVQTADGVDRAACEVGNINGLVKPGGGNSLRLRQAQRSGRGVHRVGDLRRAVPVSNTGVELRMVVVVFIVSIAWIADTRIPGYWGFAENVS